MRINTSKQDGSPKAVEAKPVARRASQTMLSRRPWNHRMRAQIPILVITVLVLQLIALFVLTGTVGGNVQAVVSMVGAQLTNIVGALSFRAAQRVPGASSLGFILPALTVAYIVLIMCFFVLRIPYSVWLIAVGYVSALLVLWWLSSRGRSTPSDTIYVVESAKTRELLAEIDHLPLQILASSDALVELTNGAVVVDLREDLSAEWERSIAQAVLRGIPVFHVKQAYESLTGKVRFDHLSENHFGSLVPSLSYLAMKRLLDVIIAAIALMVLLVPMLAIGLAIRMNSPGPAIFKHNRIGYQGQPFQTFKFRTMRQRARNDEDRESQITQENDPRVTSVGRFLRSTRLDELPQLINVLRGEMSLIGPRPEAAALSKWYYDRLDFYEYRHVVKPGITGWAQVNQGHVTSIDEIFHKTQYDFYYIKNVSIWLDFLIAIKTVEIMISKRGAR